MHFLAFGKQLFLGLLVTSSSGKLVLEIVLFFPKRSYDLFVNSWHLLMLFLSIMDRSHFTTTTYFNPYFSRQNKMGCMVTNGTKNYMSPSNAKRRYHCFLFHVGCGTSSCRMEMINFLSLKCSMLIWLLSCVHIVYGGPFVFNQSILEQHTFLSKILEIFQQSLEHTTLPPSRHV